MGTDDSTLPAQSTADHLAEGPRSTPESETPTSDRTGLGRYRWLLAGLVLVLIGVAGLATFLVAAGVGASGKAGVLAVATVAAFGVGTAVMVAAVRPPTRVALYRSHPRGEAPVPPAMAAPVAPSPHREPA